MNAGRLEVKSFHTLRAICQRLKMNQRRFTIELASQLSRRICLPLYRKSKRSLHSFHTETIFHLGERKETRATSTRSALKILALVVNTQWSYWGHQKRRNAKLDAKENEALPLGGKHKKKLDKWLTLAETDGCKKKEKGTEKHSSSSRGIDRLWDRSNNNKSTTSSAAIIFLFGLNFSLRGGERGRESVLKN